MLNGQYQIGWARLIRKVNIGRLTKSEDNLVKKRGEFWHSRNYTCVANWCHGQEKTIAPPRQAIDHEHRQEYLNFRALNMNFD